MLPPLTPALARAVAAASRLAAGRGEASTPLDLLHALLEDDFSAAFALAARAGFDPARYDAYRPAIPADGGDTSPTGDRVSTVLHRAGEAVVDPMGESDISGDAALVALVREDVDCRSLAVACGLDPARLESAVEERRPLPVPVEAAFRFDDVTERVDVARILDASFNRAREALRVVEDYCRFALNDAFLSEQLKSLRHELRSALGELGPYELILARDTENDVGTTIATEAEYSRTSLLDVARANLKRLDEALRSLEEFAKVGRPHLAERVEKLRYRAYTVERAVVVGADGRSRLRRATLYALLSRSACTSSIEWTIEEAAAGGLDVVQLREKSLGDRELLALAREVRRVCRKAGVAFIVNDRPDIARLCEADGVHLGQDDVSVRDARRILGPDALIGVSTHDLAQVDRAVMDGASYIGVGPTFASTTKSFDALAGTEFVRAAVARTSLPAFAIGGINAETIHDARAAGARRVAVGAALAAADDPRRMAHILKSALTTPPPE